MHIQKKPFSPCFIEVEGKECEKRKGNEAMLLYTYITVASILPMSCQVHAKNLTMKPKLSTNNKDA